MSDGHERFRILMVDEDARLYRFVSSDRSFHDACIIRDLLREWNGGHWIILDGPRGRCVADTRPRSWPLSAECNEADPGQAGITRPPSCPRPAPVAKPTRRRGARPPIEVD